MCRRLFREALGERGVAAVEFAFVLPLLIVFVLGLIQLARAIQLQTTLDYAIQMAARCYAVGTCANKSATEAYAQSIATGLTAPTSVFVMTPNACGPTVGGVQDGVLVTASLVFNFLGSGVAPIGAGGSGIPTSVTLGSTACITTS
jgi:Flp pilus assembly protein TadG